MTLFPSRIFSLYIFLQILLQIIPISYLLKEIPLLNGDSEISNKYAKWMLNLIKYINSFISEINGSIEVHGNKCMSKQYERR